MKFSVGQRVCVKGFASSVGTIQECFTQNGQNWYRVDFNGEVRTLREKSLEAYKRPLTTKSAFLEGKFGSKSNFTKLLTLKKLTEPVRNNLYALFASRTEFHAYQYKPLLKFLDAFDQRILIADEVGLGKTIEAGLILIEQRARNPLNRVLIVAPSALTKKWKSEMEFRFDEEFEIMTTKKFKEFLNKLENDDWHKPLRAIVSLQTLRSRSILVHLENLEPHFDLVIVDEAHHMRNAGTKSNRLGRILSECSDAMLLLTATPIHLGNKDLFNLLQILKPEDFFNYYTFENLTEANRYIINAEKEIIKREPDLKKCKQYLMQLQYHAPWLYFDENPIYNDVMDRLQNEEEILKNRRKRLELQRDINSLNLLSHVINRTRKREVQTKIAVRTPIEVRHPFTLEEQQFYDAVTNYVISQYQDYGNIALLVAMNYQRQVASCIPAMLKYYRKKFGILEKMMVTYSDCDVSDFDYDDYFENNGEDIDDEMIKAEDKSIFDLVDSFKFVENIDSKYDALLRKIKELDEVEPGRKILIFSYFKRTIEYLAERLAEDGYRTAFIHGDVEPETRRELMVRFREDPSLRILVLSEVGSEGLDFQFCHILINYDLPWNPMKVEQRIGRIDRFGQPSERIIIINLVTENTIEEKIYDRLYQRIRIFEESIGELEPILGNYVKEITETLLSSTLTEEEKEIRLEEISNAIERDRLELEKLESERERLIAFDGYFEQEISRMTNSHNYIAGEELQIFVSEFLRKKFPRLKLKRTKDPKIFIFPLSQELINMLQNYFGDKNDERVSKILSAYYQNKYFKITFDSETANRIPEVAFLHNFHPIIQMIKNYYDKNKEDLFPVSKIAVTYKNQPWGYYFYFIYLIQFTGARAEKRFETIIIRRDTKKILPLDEAEEFIGYVKVKGKDIDVIDDIPKSELQDVYNKAQSYFIKLLEQREKELERNNTNLINSRIASIKKTYEYKIQNAQKRLENALDKKQDERIIRMHRGRIRNLKDEMNRKINEIKQNSEVDYSYEEIAAGIIINEDRDD